MKRSLLIPLLFATACGDNNPDVTPDAKDNMPMPTTPRAVVVAGDFITPGFAGVMSKLDLASMAMSQDVAPDGAIGSDPVLRKLGNELFVVNRAGGNNVTIFDADTLAVKEQLATGAGSDPMDVASYANKLFVPAMRTAGVVVLTRGSTTKELIDLSSLDPDGLPDCVSAYRAGNDIYVACELLDQNFSPRGAGKVAVIDALTLQHRATITLSNPNPFGVFTQLPDGSLVIPTFDFANATARCLEHVVPSTTTPYANGCLVQNAEVGGYVVAAAVQPIGDTDMLWLVVNNGNFANERARLWGYDLTTKNLWDAPLSPEDQVLTDVAACPNDLVIVADKTMSANGLRVYQNGTLETTTEPLAVGLRPQSSPAIVCY